MAHVDQVGGEPAVIGLVAEEVQASHRRQRDRARPVPGAEQLGHRQPTGSPGRSRRTGRLRRHQQQRQRAQRQRRQAADPQQQRPVPLRDQAERQAQHDDRAAERRVQHAGQAAAQAGRKQRHVDPNMDREARAEEDAEQEALREQLRIARHQEPQQQHGGIAEDGPGEQTAAAEPVRELSQHDRAAQRAGTLRGVERSRLQQAQLQGGSQERTQHVDRVPGPAVKELAGKQQREDRHAAPEGHDGDRSTCPVGNVGGHAVGWHGLLILSV